MERRGATRYRLRLVVTFSWTDQAGTVYGGEGESRDLNGRGIYVSTSLIPPVGASVDMNVLLPRLEPVKRPAELHAEGRVVRIDGATPQHQQGGFAAMNHTAVLRDAEGRTIDGQDSWKEFGLGESDD